MNSSDQYEWRRGYCRRFMSEPSGVEGSKTLIFAWMLFTERQRIRDMLPFGPSEQVSADPVFSPRAMRRK